MTEPRVLLLSVQAALADGRLEDAERMARQAIAGSPFVAECHNALGVVLRTRGFFAEAIASYETACALDPQNTRALNNLGEVLHAQGRSEEAEPCLLAALKNDPIFVEGWKNLAAVLRRLRRLDEACMALERLSVLAPKDIAVTLERAGLAHERGDVARAGQLYEQALTQDPASLEALNNLGALHLERGDLARAASLFERAQRIAPEDLASQYGVRETRARLVPPWHVGMMNEAARNHAYDAAIRAVVTPRDQVLEIGTGAGLLAMMAARAGARHVTTCEMVEPVARAAAEIVEANGFADRVSVIAKKSTDLRLGVDLQGKADVLVSEILANDFIGEGVIESFLDARARLLKPQARIIPAGGAVRLQLVGGPAVEAMLRVGTIHGFDFTTFNQLAPWRQELGRRIDYLALSAEVDALCYDFTTLLNPPPPETRLLVEVTRAGYCVAILQWLRIDLAPGIAYENHPARVESVWNPVLYALPAPRRVAPGDRLEVRLRQSGNYIYVTAS